MDREQFEQLGALHKGYEAHLEQTLTPGSPVIARLDGRSFSVFTRGLERPYDAAFAECMRATAAYLVEENHASLAYRQSDEITLVWLNQDPLKPMLFDGRVNKLVTTLAAQASVMFNRKLAELLPTHAHKMPTLDARVCQYPTLELVVSNLLWRETDCLRNSVTNLAHVAFGHKALQGVGTEQKLARLREAGQPWEAMPEVYRRGVYLRRKSVLKQLSDAELQRIPEKHRPQGPVVRSEVLPLTLPLLEDLANPEQALFLNEEPLMRAAA